MRRKSQAVVQRAGLEPGEVEDVRMGAAGLFEVA